MVSQGTGQREDGGLRIAGAGRRRSQELEVRS